MKSKKLAEISKKLVSNGKDYMSSFRNNIRTYMKEADITINELSEEANMPFDTLKNFIYGDSKDCKLSTAISLSRALNISVDELIGAETIPEPTRSNIAICRNLPDNSLYLIRWYIKHQEHLYSKIPKGKKIISVMDPLCNNNGSLKMTDVYNHTEISDLSADIISKVFFGIKIPCEHYMPYYSPYDILLIANDRSANINEHIIVEIGDFIFIAKRKFENGVSKLYGIRDNKYRCDEKDVDDIVGYVAGVITDRGLSPVLFIIFKLNFLCPLPQAYARLLQKHTALRQIPCCLSSAFHWTP